jgi:NAD(P)-dependent dehydrogenase (short-subunit alcohol dehydrogenase family)
MRNKAMSQHNLKGKTVLITGGAKNLGGLISRKFAEQGANLLIHYNSAATQSDAEETLQAVQALGVKAILVQADLANIQNIEDLFVQAKAEFGGVDIAINTVGRVLKKPFLDTTEQEFDGMNDINNKIAYFFIQSAGRHLNPNGKICTIVTSLLAAYTGLYSTYEGLKAPVNTTHVLHRKSLVNVVFLSLLSHLVQWIHLFSTVRKRQKLWLIINQHQPWAA